MDIDTKEKVAEIRRLNDQFRTTFQGGQILLSQSFADLPDMVKAAALMQVRDFTDFNQENDPYEEHDYLSFDLCNREFIFKIDYYDLQMEHRSLDPADPKITKRVGVLMMSWDW